MVLGSVVVVLIILGTVEILTKYFKNVPFVAMVIVRVQNYQERWNESPLLFEYEKDFRLLMN